MEDRTLRILEFDKIIAMLAEKCVSRPGRDMALALKPENQKLLIDNALDETNEAVGFILRNGSSPMRMFLSVRDSVKRAQIGGMLSMRQLLDIASFIGVCRHVRNKLKSDEAEKSILDAMADLVYAPFELEQDIKDRIISEEEMDDHASAKLAAIRRKIRESESRVRDILESIIRSPKGRDYLQEAIITLREGRFVVPVKAEHKAQVPGLVHDVSSSGSTIFIEPMRAVELNNSIKTLRTEENLEIEQILIELSGQVGVVADGLVAAQETMDKLDFIFAKGQLALDMDGMRPDIIEGARLYLEAARHPLIRKDAVVPIDVWVGGDFDALIITGPNTGGKTVTLKTSGLFVLMAQSGLFLPAASGSTLPVYGSVYVDIGDEQSIEQSLSTFSSHMTNIVSIMQNAGAESLVLLDELGAGTDPVEGAALAIAILEELLDKGATVMATTHYSELKEYALTHQNVENAAMEFNVETLSPTYKLGIGIPGKSNAFEISRRLGLSADIIKKAREHIEEEGIRFEDVLSSAERNRVYAIRQREEAERMREDSRKLLERAENEYELIRRKEEVILEKAREEARKILEDARETSEAVIADLKDVRQNAGTIIDREIQAARDMLREAGKDVAPKLSRKKSNLKSSDIKPGDSVKLLDSGVAATVLSNPNAKGEVQVQAGIVKLTTAVSNLQLTDDKPEGTPKQSGPSRLRLEAAPIELDIRGQGSEEGILAVDMYLDNAYRSGLKQVQIIHGKGTGTLRNAVHQFLRKHPHVKSYRLGVYGEGETGVTVVEIK